MEQELKEFDAKCSKPLPPILQRWRTRWVKQIQKATKGVPKPSYQLDPHSYDAYNIAPYA
jgi:hypothetical protein